MPRIPCRAPSPALTLPLVLLASCNGGLAAVLSGDDDDADSPPSVAAFEVQGAAASPATIRFRVVDADGDEARVSLFYSVAGGETTLVTRLVDAENPADYAGSAEGVAHEVDWDFAAEPGLAAGGGFTGGVTVFASVDGAGGLVPGANAVELGLGNDAPSVEVVDAPTEEQDGIVPIALRFADSSGDELAARVEFRVAGEGTWTAARPAGAAETPEFALVGVDAAPDGVDATFFWDTDADLPDLERDVRLRVTPTDGLAEGEPVATELLRIDNNDAPVAVLDNGLVASEARDARGGIALPFALRDAESDAVGLVLQWRRPGEAFPVLPEDPSEALALREDPELRALHQVCTPEPAHDAGRPVGVDAARLRLPELGTEGVDTAPADLVGRELELLRPPGRLEDVTGRWAANPLLRPSAVVPLGDGREALVLDRPVPQTWRLLRVELATGAVVQDIAAGSGGPRGLAVDPREEVAFVASDLGGAWRLERRDLAEGTVLSALEGDYVQVGGIRGIAALSSLEAVFTVDREVRVASFARDPAVVRTAAGLLGRPWGVARDPLDRGAVLVALEGEDRVASLDLATGVLAPLADGGEPWAPALASPRGLALERGGSRVLVVTGEDEPRELRTLRRGGAHDVDGDGRADPLAHVVATLPEGSGTFLGTGRDGLRALSGPDHGVLVLGGVEQRRTVVSVTGGDLVELDAPLAPPLATLQDTPRTWRVARTPRTWRAGPEDRGFRFAWDSSDVPRGGEILFRAVPFDSERGFSSSTSVARAIVSDVGVRRAELDPGRGGAQASPSFLDVDRDGDLDVLVSQGPDSRVVVQEAPGRYAPPADLGLALEGSLGLPLVAVDLDRDGLADLVHVREDRVVEVRPGWDASSAPLLGPWNPSPALELEVPGEAGADRRGEVVAGDVDGDADLDLVVALPAAGAGDAVHVFLQVGGGVFDPVPLAVGGGGATDRPVAVELADVDGDGFLDLVVAADGVVGPDGSDSGRACVLFQEAPGVFAAEPLVLGALDPALPGTYATAAARDVATADVDLDGDLDVLVAHGPGEGASVPLHAGRVTVFRQTAPGVFETEPLVLSGPAGASEPPFAVDAADLNADGLPDVLAASGAGLRVHFGRRTGGLDPTPLLLPHAAPGALEAPHVPPLEPADADGDGDLDLVFFEPGSGAVVLRATGARGVERFADAPLLVDAAGALDAAVLDLDADGARDLASARAVGGLVAAAQGAPRVFPSSPVPVDGAPAAPLWTRAADLERDGEPDLLAADAAGELRILPVRGGAVEGAIVLEPFGVAGVAVARPLDADGDGDLDLFVCAREGAALVGYERTAAGDLVEALRVEAGTPLPGTPRSRDLAGADLDGDGDLELLLAVEAVEGGGLLVYDGSGPFAVAAEPTVLGASAAAVRVVELDGDGRPDLLVLERLPGAATGRLVAYLRGEDGAFEARPAEFDLRASDGAAATFAVADLDGDGDADVLGLAPDGELLRLDQVAPGRFAPGVPAGPGGAAALGLVDVDGDAEPDALLSGPDGLRVSWGNDG